MSDLQTLVAQEAQKQLATFTADATVKKVLNHLKSSGGGLPLGHLFAWPFQTPPDGAIQCNGAEYNRALYADFFAHASSKGWVKTESEWQQIALTNGGFCPWYSDGDGSTTFRTPKFAPFMQVAIASGNVGSYHEAGLPNITGTTSALRTVIDGFPRATGAFNHSKSALNSEKLLGGAYTGTSADSKAAIETFDASRESEVYGKSATVQPESSEWMICVVVFGVATNVGSTDVSNVMSAVAQIQAELPNKLNNTTPHIVDTWKSGSEWYRKWSDGFIEQGGVATVGNSHYAPVTFPHPFSNTYYSISGYADEDESNVSVIGVKVTYNPVRTNTSCGLVISWCGGGDSGYMPKGHKVYWAAVGY